MDNKINDFYINIAKTLLKSNSDELFDIIKEKCTFTNLAREQKIVITCDYEGLTLTSFERNGR